MAILRATHPISFHLLDRDGNQVIGIFDGKQGQVSTLEVTNRSRRDLRLKKLAGAPSATNHHFELKFRPDTLSATSTITIAESSGWLISNGTDPDGGVSLYLMSKETLEVKSGRSTSVKLKGLNADSTGGARGTRMELKWEEGPLEYTSNGSGALPETLVAGHRVQHLEIVNERGQKHIPLHVGFVGTNQVLNNGSNNILKLRITNQLKQGSIQLIGEKDPEYPTSTFILSFDASNKEEWTMGTVNEVSSFKVTAVAAGKTFIVKEPVVGQSPVWIITPPSGERITLGPEAFVEVTIDNVKTNYQAGETNLYLHYKNITGYWDGDFVTVVEKSPVIYGKSMVGIWTTDPRARLHVNGNLRVEWGVSIATGAAFEMSGDGGQRFKVGVNGNTGIATSNPQERLHVVGSALVEGGNILFKDQGQIKSHDETHRILFRRAENKLEFREAGDIIFSPGSTDGFEKAKVVMLSDGKVGIGTGSPRTQLEIVGGLRVENSVSIGGSDTFEVDGVRNPGGRFKVQGNGNIGIGTPTPGAYINENNYFKADKDGRILEVHSPQNESVLILSTNQNANNAHLGGVYFTRTAGQSDAHREVAAIKCRQVQAGDMGGGCLQFFTKPNGGGATFDNPRMVIRDNGYVGIGTTDPTKAALQIDSSVNAEVKGYGYLNDGVNKPMTGRENRTLTMPYSIWASKRVAAEEFNAVSDGRIKEIRGRSNSALDLSTLLGIEITDYSFKDVIGKGSGNYKKVIGQQVEKVFPQAVSRQTDFVPDIYQQARISDGWVTLATDLKQGDRVKLITEKSEGIHEVLEVMEDKFRVDGELEGEKVFVFGREVDDLHVVDYDAIAMLNVSATQQLKKEMDEQLEALRVENAELRAANDDLATRLQLLESKLESVAGVMAAANGSNGNGRH